MCDGGNSLEVKKPCKGKRKKTKDFVICKANDKSERKREGILNSIKRRESCKRKKKRLWIVKFSINEQKMRAEADTKQQQPQESQQQNLCMILRQPTYYQLKKGKLNFSLHKLQNDFVFNLF